MNMNIVAYYIQIREQLKNFVVNKEVLDVLPYCKRSMLQTVTEAYDYLVDKYCQPAGTNDGLMYRACNFKLAVEHLVKDVEQRHEVTQEMIDIVTHDLKLLVEEYTEACMLSDIESILKEKENEEHI